MKITIEVKAPRSQNVVNYLIKKGWEKEKDCKHFSVWNLDDSKILVPVDPTFEDFDQDD